MRKEWILPVLIGGLLLVVGILSVLLVFFRGQPQLIRHKIKLGLIVISLQALATGCGSALDTGEVVSCYAKPVFPDIMSLVNPNYKEGRHIYQKNGDTIHVNVSERQSTAFSFILLDASGKAIEQGRLQVKDGVLNKPWEELFVPLPSGLEAGKYQLVFYNAPIKDTVAVENRRASYPVILE